MKTLGDLLWGRGNTKINFFSNRGLLSYLLGSLFAGGAHKPESGNRIGLGHSLLGGLINQRVAPTGSGEDGATATSPGEGEV